MGIKMAELKGLIRTITTTRNFWTALILRYSKGKKRVSFRNGSTFWLTWSQYWKVRDVMLAGYRVEQVGDGVFKINNAEIELIGSSDMLRTVCELHTGFYDWDCRGKVVLDVGGFQGESAVFFFKDGAEKVIIYEPVIAHHEFIKRNMLLNRVNGELHEEGIGSADDIKTIRYDATDPAFGLDSKGQHEMRIKIRNVANVIEESHADVAKFNCEGAEESLIYVPTEVLRKIDAYMIMAHTPKISKAIIDKFERSGFSLVKKNKQYSFVCFKKKGNSARAR
jgi:FkbM family methyltransferase